MIFGAKPGDNDQAIEEVGAVIYIIAERIDEEFAKLENSNSPEQVAIALVSAIRLLSQEFSSSISIMLEREQFEGWKEKFTAWFETKGQKIPKKHRDGVWKNAMKEFDMLDKHIS